VIGKHRQKFIIWLAGKDKNRKAKQKEEKAHLSGFKVCNNLSLTIFPRIVKSSPASLI
jgi:hypothetical protein